MIRISRSLCSQQPECNLDKSLHTVVTRLIRFHQLYLTIFIVTNKWVRVTFPYLEAIQHCMENGNMWHISRIPAAL
jgi:hypothetical protein